MRPSRILAVARSDWAVEFKGRQGLVLPAVLAGLLLPSAWAPNPADRLLPPDPSAQGFAAGGEVPEQIASLPSRRSRSPVRLEFRQDSSGTWWVGGPFIPAEVRAALDGGAPAVVLEEIPRGYVLPGRTMLFAMVSSSTLTGAVASSIGGERSRKTLLVLLSASLSRAEVVLGKALAWSAWGVGASLLAAGGAIAWGRAEPGWWLLPMVSVPLSTVCLGLWLVRSAADVVAGTATSLRALPAALALSGVVAYLLGEWHPLAGALVPLGGALIAAGDTWQGPWAPLLASATTLGLAGAALAGTTRDLEESPETDPPEQAWLLAGLGLLIGAVCWWLPVLAPLLWASAGNPRMGEVLSLEAGVAAGSGSLLVASGVRAARSLRGREGVSPAAPDRLPGWAAAAGVGMILPFLPSIRWAPFEQAPLVAERLAAASSPSLAWAGLVLLADELMFRGWLQRGSGPVLATLVWTAVKCPLDPIQGLVGGALLAWVAGRAGSPLASLSARAVALGVAMLWP